MLSLTAKFETCGSARVYEVCWTVHCEDDSML